MPVLQHVDDFGKRGILLRKQHEEMVDKVGSLAQEEVLVIILRGDDELDGLLPDLLRYLVQPPGEEMVRIGTLNRVGAPVADH